MKLSTPQGHDFSHYHAFYSALDFYDETGIHRGWLATVGTLYLILGVIGLSMATLMTIVSVMFFGALAIVGGVVQLGQSFTAHGTRNVAVGAVLGVLYLTAGAVLLLNPLAASVMLTLILASALIALGIVRIVFSLQYRANKYWHWSIISGLISIAVGVMIIAQWPVTGLWVIGLFVSVEMVFHGIALLVLAIEKNKVPSKSESRRE